MLGGLKDMTPKAHIITSSWFDTIHNSDTLEQSFHIVSHQEWSCYCNYWLHFSSRAIFSSQDGD